jgi:uncharacterized protein
VAEALAADVDSRVPAGAEVVADVVLEAFDGGVAVSGTVSTRWEGQCRRCLNPVGGDLVSQVKEIFRRGGGPEEGTYPMSEDGASLREMALDALFAALPLLPLCRADCRGICQRCGAELDVSACGCEEPRADPRWSVLDVLRSAAPITQSQGGDQERGRHGRPSV